jgi:hypothetical protein
VGSFIRYLKCLIEERSAKRSKLDKIPECHHKYADGKGNMEEDEEFELKHGREDTTLYIKFQSVRTFQANGDQVSPRRSSNQGLWIRASGE